MCDQALTSSVLILKLSRATAFNTRYADAQVDLCLRCAPVQSCRKCKWPGQNLCCLPSRDPNLGRVFYSHSLPSADSRREFLAKECA